jgi:hypothetical protein
MNQAAELEAAASAMPCVWAADRGAALRAVGDQWLAIVDAVLLAGVHRHGTQAARAEAV